MSGSGLHWNCLSICRPERSPLFGCVCDLDIDFSVGTDLIGFCFLGLMSFFSFCLTCIENFKFLVDRGLWLVFDLYYCILFWLNVCFIYQHIKFKA